MPKFEITIADTRNAAFIDDSRVCIRYIAEQIHSILSNALDTDERQDSHPIRDTNGNKVGEIVVTGESFQQATGECNAMTDRDHGRLQSFLATRDANEVIAAILNAHEVDWSYILLNSDDDEVVEILDAIDWQDLETGDYTVKKQAQKTAGSIHEIQMPLDQIERLLSLEGVDAFLFERTNKDLLPEIHIQCADIEGYTGRDPHIWKAADDLLMVQSPEYAIIKHMIDFARDIIVILPSDHL